MLGKKLLRPAGNLDQSRLCWYCRSCCQYKKVLGRSSKQDCGTEDAGENPRRTMVSQRAELWHKTEAGCRTIIIIISAHVPYNNTQGCAQRQKQVGTQEPTKLRTGLCSIWTRKSTGAKSSLSSFRLTGYTVVTDQLTLIYCLKFASDEWFKT